MDKHYLKELNEAKERGAYKEHIERMEFLSKGDNVENRINKWIKSVMKNESFWFDSNITDRSLILNKAIQHGIQLCLDLYKER